MENNSDHVAVTVAKPESRVPDADEITADQCIELEGELQKEWARKAIAETRAAASLLEHGQFRSGMETACDEIETRIGTGYEIQNQLGKCCYGGLKTKSACASCAAWSPTPDELAEQFRRAVAGPQSGINSKS